MRDSTKRGRSEPCARLARLRRSGEIGFLDVASDLA